MEIWILTCQFSIKNLIFPLLYILPHNWFSSEDEDGLGDDRKKRPRTAFTAAQIKALECEFEKNKYLSVSKRMQLSKQLKLTETQVCVHPTVLRPGKT